MDSRHDFDIIQTEVCKFLNKSLVIPKKREDDEFVSKMFRSSKRDDTCRMILDLKKFNDFLLVPYCKLESTEDALNLMT